MDDSKSKNNLKTYKNATLSQHPLHGLKAAKIPPNNR